MLAAIDGQKEAAVAGLMEAAKVAMGPWKSPCCLALGDLQVMQEAAATSAADDCFNCELRMSLIRKLDFFCIMVHLFCMAHDNQRAATHTRATGLRKGGMLGRLWSV